MDRLYEHFLDFVTSVLCLHGEARRRLEIDDTAESVPGLVFHFLISKALRMALYEYDLDACLASVTKLSQTASFGQAHSTPGDAQGPRG